jgi:hypothetical protein
MPIGTEAWTSPTVVVIAVACALTGIASMIAQLRNCDETIAKVRSALDSDPGPDGDGIKVGERAERP